MKITLEEVEHVARLARLRVSEEETRRLTGQLNDILGYMDKLGELDTSDIEPMAHALALDTPWREDRVGESLDPDEALANAPERQGEYFRVPKVF